MRRRFLSRRDFLRLSSVAAGALALPGAARHVRAQAGGSVAISGGSADIWAWEQAITGTIRDLDCESIIVNAAENSIDAALADGQFSATVPIREGENDITATCQQSDGQTMTSNPIHYAGRLRDVPRSNIAITIEGDQIHLDGSGSLASEDTQTPIASWTWAARAGNPASLSLEDGTEAQVITLETPDTDGEYYVQLTVTDEAGRSDTSTTYFRVVNGQAELDDWATENTDWVENTVCYGVIPRNFGSPGFQAVIDRLDYLADLGINSLWLAPVNVSPPGDYGYAVMDYFDVSDRYGDLEDFRRLVREAHARGIRVLMDLVPNHSSIRHPYFQDALVNGADSPYWDFYARDEDGMPTNYFDWQHLPNLNYENPAVRRWMIEASAYWVREFDIDGYRVDVAWGIRERRPDFWPEWRAELKRIKPDLLLLAEASARDEFYFEHGFDAAYDWTGALGHWAWELVFEDPALMLFNLNAALTNLRKGFHDDALIFRFINNNDTGTRFVAKYGNDMTFLATALLLTLPGIPCIYTGDEAGALFTPYGDAGAISFNERVRGLVDYHRRLIHLRRETPALHSRDWTILFLEPHTRVYGYLRHLEDKSAPVMVLINFMDEPAEVEINVPEGFEAFFAQASFQDLLSGEAVTPSNTEPFTVTMQPLSSLILA